MSSREVRRKVVNISTPSYSFAKIHKVDEEPSPRPGLKRIERPGLKRVNPDGTPYAAPTEGQLSGNDPAMLRYRCDNGHGPFKQNEMKINPNPRNSKGLDRYLCPECGLGSDMGEGINVTLARKLGGDIESQDTEQKMIPPNEALEEKGKTQEASWGTAIENEDEVAGEDVKIERQKAQKEKEQKLGVGHLSEDKPTTYKIKKQLENLKNIIKQPASVLKGFDDQFLQGSEEASNAIRDSDQSRKQGIDSGLIPFDEENDHTGSGHQMWGADDGNWFCLAHNVRIPDPRDPGTYGRSDIEQTSLGEALGIERPRIE
jgi:hypothetical protein